VRPDVEPPGVVSVLGAAQNGGHARAAPGAEALDDDVVAAALEHADAATRPGQRLGTARGTWPALCDV
jgi:hypothetical protein